uniref:CCHC-type domain-containing protein n=1 Tax=Tanacetum cinerariifolium TaxID=118510 RepID=A0A6L2NEL8_TANCI|nr:hypothetical protein [Tanacetum cinerariifolium]
MRESSITDASLPPKWSKFLTDLKLVKDLHTTNFDQLHAYLEQHELHANEVRLLCERNQDPLAFVANQQMTQPHFNTYQSSYNNPQLQQRDDPIACLNKAIAFLTAVASSRVTVQQVQGRQGQSYSGTGYKSNATSSRGNNTSGQARDVKCYNCQGEGHMARKYTQPKQPKIAAWVPNGQAAQKIIPNNVVFQIEDLDTYDSDCDDISNVKAVLMANISNYGSDVILEIPHYETYLNDMENQSYQNLFYLKKAQRMKPTLYNGIVISNKHVSMPVIDDDEETLILEEDFRKRFVPQQELLADEAFWYHMLNPSTKSSDALPVKIEAPKELPKVILVNESLKNLKLHLANFDKVVKIKTAPNAQTEGEWGFEHTKAIFNNEIILFLKYLKDIFNVFNKDLLNEILEVQTVFDQMEDAIQQYLVGKQCLEIAKKESLLENGRLLQQIMSQDVLLTVMKSM